jgi:UV DNA damage endonuclease
MRLGFAAKVLGPDKKGLRVEDARKRMNNPNLGESLRLANIALDWIQEAGIEFWRLPSHMAPYGSHPQWKEYWGQGAKYDKELQEFGARLQGMRITKHPGQYTVLNSPHEYVRENSIRDLTLQAELMDRMGIPADEGVMILHIGGRYKDPEGARAQLIKTYSTLPESVRARLVFENDDKSWSAAEVQSIVAELSIPMVFDLHHHRCHNPEGIPLEEAFRSALASWPVGRKPKIHISSGKTSGIDRSHAQGIALDDWNSWVPLFDTAERDFDIMIEAKDKDWAVLDLAREIAVGNALRPKYLDRLPGP